MLGGLVILVLPDTAIVATLAGTGLAALGSSAHAVLAIAVASVVGGLLFLGAASLSAKTRPHRDAGGPASAGHLRLHPLDPAHELGTASFDEPLSAMPFAVPDSEAQSEPHRTETDGIDEDPTPPPLALDLAEFANLPGRNAVWVEQIADPATLEQTPAPAPCPAALTRLRAVPPEQLSTIQMVERFAAALQEHRDAASGKAGQPRIMADREAVLAEALKALALLSGPDGAANVGVPLREAIAELQPRRGVA